MTIRKQSLQSKYEDMYNLTNKYELSVIDLKSDLENLRTFKVTTPIVGGFRTGKSSMMNAFLNEQLLRTNISAESAVPTEIAYGGNEAQYVKGDVVQQIPIQDVYNKTFTIDAVDVIRVQLQSDVLKQYPTLEIVDMPGFDSGIAAHNRAIDKYLHKSLAYILTIAADEPIINETISDFLKEIKLYSVPVYVCITKSDKISASALSQVQQDIVNTLQTTLGITVKKIVTTCAIEPVDTSGFADILLDIEQNSQQFFENKFTKLFMKRAYTLTRYLEERIRNEQLTILEIDEKLDKVNYDMNAISQKVVDEQLRFNEQVDAAVVAIANKVEQEIKDNQEVLVSMLKQGSDVQVKLNLIIRSAIKSGIHSEFEPKIRQHIENLTQSIRIDIPIERSKHLEEFKKQSDEIIKNVAVKSLPLLLGAIGVALTGPIGGIIIGTATLLADLMFSKKRDDEILREAEVRLNEEILPLVVDESKSLIEQELKKYTGEVHVMIQQEIGKKRAVLEKVLQDLRQQKEQEQLQQQSFTQQLEEDLQRVNEMVNEVVQSV